MGNSKKVMKETVQSGRFVQNGLLPGRPFFEIDILEEFQKFCFPVDYPTRIEPKRMQNGCIYHRKGPGYPVLGDVVQMVGVCFSFRMCFKILL